MLFQNDFRVGRHLGFQLAAGVVNGDSHLKSRHIVFLHAHRRDPRDLTLEGLIFKRFHLDARRLSQVHLADIALVNFALYVNFTRISQRHNQRSRRTQHENGAHGIAHFHIPREHDSINRRLDIGVAELLLELLQVGSILRYRSFRLRHLGPQNYQLRFRDVLLVEGHFVIFLGIVQS